MSSKIEVLKARAKADGVKPVNDASKKSVRSIDLDNPEVGDVLILTENQIYERPIGTNKADFVYVDRVDKDGKVIENSTTVLYLGQLTRVVAEYDPETMTRTGNIIKASGTVVDALQAVATWKDGLALLEDKKFKVSGVTVVDARDFNNSGQTRKQSVFSFDFV